MASIFIRLHIMAFHISCVPLQLKMHIKKHYRQLIVTPLLWVLMQAVAFTQDKTSFGPETGAYGVMLQQLEHNMINYQEKWLDTLGGKPRNVFVPWIRDHVHVMKAMKYIHPDMTSFIEFFLQNQTAEGIYFDYYFPLKYGGSGDRKNIQQCGAFSKMAGSGCK